MQLNLTILIDPDIPPSLFIDLDSQLKEIFHFNLVKIHELVQLPHSCWKASRQQYDANCLLVSLMSQKRNNIVLLLIAKDAFVQNLNFVFGVASQGIGAVVSVFRLENDPEFVQKEINHELGHVFGLNHCSLPCVMTFSNSVWEARHKTKEFCKKCAAKLK